MSSVAVSGVFQILSMVLLGGGFGMPLGIPPAADPGFTSVMRVRLDKLLEVITLLSRNYWTASMSLDRNR
jgi:hypothetical protein